MPAAGHCRGIIHLEQDIATPTRSLTFEVTNTGFDAALEPSENAALCQRAGPGEGTHRRPPSTRSAIGSLSGQEMCGAATAVVGIAPFEQPLAAR
jgi:hypothetical protein